MATPIKRSAPLKIPGRRDDARVTDLLACTQIPSYQRIKRKPLPFEGDQCDSASPSQLSASPLSPGSTFSYLLSPPESLPALSRSSSSISVISNDNSPPTPSPNSFRSHKIFSPPRTLCDDPLTGLNKDCGDSVFDNKVGYQKEDIRSNVRASSLFTKKVLLQKLSLASSLTEKLSSWTKVDNHGPPIICHDRLIKPNASPYFRVPGSDTCSAKGCVVNCECQVTGTDQSPIKATFSKAESAPNPMWIQLSSWSFQMRYVGIVDRGRELRLNSDFLRAFVLEANMRKNGKLTGEGRARMTLEPRRSQNTFCT